jgi:hypothetical protein
MLGLAIVYAITRRKSHSFSSTLDS